MQPRRLPDPLPADIEVFQLELDLAAPLADADHALLSEDEGERAMRFRRHEDRVRFVSTRAALRRLLGARLQCDPQSLSLTANRYGKPRLADACSSDPAAYFNVSHAGNFSLIALSAHAPVGIDIEQRDPHCDVSALAPQALSELEQQLPDERRVDFFACWTAKEAVLKALGIGVAEHLQRLSVLKPEPDQGRRYEIRHEGMDWPCVHAMCLDSPPGYAAALAWQSVGMGEQR